MERAREKDVFDDMMKDETSRKKLIRAYIMKCGAPKGMRGGKKKKEAGFCALQFLQEVRVEEQLVRDGVYEMMHEVAFMSHTAKPKHYPPTGLDQESAKSEFLRLSRETNAFVDFLGPTQKYQMRVGIKVKTLVTHRSLTAKAQAYQLKDKEKKPLIWAPFTTSVTVTAELTTKDPTLHLLASVQTLPMFLESYAFAEVVSIVLIG